MNKVLSDPFSRDERAQTNANKGPDQTSRGAQGGKENVQNNVSQVNSFAAILFLVRAYLPEPVPC